MDDVVFGAVFVGMMALALAYVRLCERIVGRADGAGPDAGVVGREAV
jgi:hypothetical protein